MIKELLEVVENRQIAKQTYMMILAGNTSSISAPGQFIDIKVDGFYLRRPISVADWDSGSVTIIYKVVGNGTRCMSAYAKGDKLDVLMGLGNGYDLQKAKGRRIILLGGGVGVPPLLGLARILKENNEDFGAIIGFGSSDEVFGYNELKRYTDCVTVTTIDGTLGTKGKITDALDKSKYDYYFACGPEGMLKAVHNLAMDGQLSFEARMGCGFGVCMGCSCRTLTSSKRICLDGPVMLSSEISFGD